MTKEEQQRVHRLRNTQGEVEEWVECSEEEWERAEPADRRMLGLGGLQRFEPVRVRRVSASGKEENPVRLYDLLGSPVGRVDWPSTETLPLWDVLSANDVWLVLKVPAVNVLEAIPKGMSGLEARQLEMRAGRHAGAQWFVSRSGEPEHVFSVRERW